MPLRSPDNGAWLNHTTKVRKKANQVKCSVRIFGLRKFSSLKPVSPICRVEFRGCDPSIAVQAVFVPSTCIEAINHPHCFIDLDELNSYSKNQPTNGRFRGFYCCFARKVSLLQPNRSAVTHSIRVLKGDVSCRLLGRVGKKDVARVSTQEMDTNDTPSKKSTPYVIHPLLPNSTWPRMNGRDSISDCILKLSWELPDPCGQK